MKIVKLDAENFEEFHEQAANLARDHSEKRVRQTSLDWLADLTADALDEREAVVWVAVADGTDVVGVSVKTKPGGPNFTVVHEDMRRTGIATKLLAAKRAEFPDYATKAAITNVPALALLLKSGFVIAEPLAENDSGKLIARFTPPSANGASAPAKKAAKKGRSGGASLGSPRLQTLLNILEGEPEGITGPELAKRSKVAAFSTAVSELRRALAREGGRRTVKCISKTRKGKRVAIYRMEG